MSDFPFIDKVMAIGKTNADESMAIVFSFSSFDTDIALISLVAFIVPKFSAFVSYCSSIFIVQHVLRNKKRRNLVYHRLICGMSISDTFGSFSSFLSTVGMNSFVFSFMFCTCQAKTTVTLFLHTNIIVAHS